MDAKKSTRKPRSNTVEVKLSKPAASARSKSPRPQSRSQSRSRKSLPTAAKPPSPTRKAASPARTRTKKAPAASANLGAKLYTKKDAPAAVEQPAKREKSPARSPAKKSPVKASPAKRTTRAASSAAQAAVAAAAAEAALPTSSVSVVSTSSTSSSSSSASYELRRRSPRGESSPTRSSGAVQQAPARSCWLSGPCKLCSALTCPFRNWFGTGYLNCTMASIAHILAITLLLIGVLFVLNRYDLVECKCITESFAKFTNFVVENFNTVAKRVGLGGK